MTTPEDFADNPDIKPSKKAALTPTPVLVGGAILLVVLIAVLVAVLR